MYYDSLYFTEHSTHWPHLHFILKVELNRNKHDASKWNYFYYGCFWSAELWMECCVPQQWRTFTGTDHISMPLLSLCAIMLHLIFTWSFYLYFSFFHDYLSHPLRLRQGGLFSEPECPSVCSGNTLLGNKTKTTGFHSTKRFCLPLQQGLLLQSIEFQNRRAGRQGG